MGMSQANVSATHFENLDANRKLEGTRELTQKQKSWFTRWYEAHERAGHDETTWSNHALKQIVCSQTQKNVNKYSAVWGNRAAATETNSETFKDCQRNWPLWYQDLCRDAVKNVINPGSKMDFRTYAVLCKRETLQIQIMFRKHQDAMSQHGSAGRDKRYALEKQRTALETFLRKKTNLDCRLLDQESELANLTRLCKDEQIVKKKHDIRGTREDLDWLCNYYAPLLHLGR